MAAPQINITLGTAGHVDHGKTEMVKLLTGCETDRLKEEKERGLSIELGFAPCLVAGQEVGIVDVPGHENFIKTMVAGATGMDGVILVVAADDGIMPQTREHLDILTLLGVEHGMVALTKIDRVSPERLAEAQSDVAAFLKGTFLEGAPILPISNLTGEGFDAFLKSLQALVRSIEPKAAGGVFRLPVENTFSVKGYGTVVTGIPVAGAAATGDEVVLLPHGMTGRVTGLQVYGRDADAARAGQCAAINVRHWDAKAIRRGDVLALPGFFSPAEWYVCRLRLLPHKGLVLKNASRVKFHTGTSELASTVYLMHGDHVLGGQECFVQFRLPEPVVAGPGDPFIMRTTSPPVTVGGGIVIEATPQRLRRKEAGLIEDLDNRARAVCEDMAFVEYSLRTAAAGAATDGDLSSRCKVLLPRLREILKELTGAGRAVALGGGLYAHHERMAAAEKTLLGLLDDFHQRSPESLGVPRDELLQAAGLPQSVIDGSIARLKDTGIVAERSGRLALAEHRETYGDEDREAMAQVESLFRNAPFKPPSPDDVPRAAGLPPERAEKAVRLLVEQQQLVQVSPTLLFHREAVDRARELLTDYIAKEGRLESVKFKYLIEATRKYAIPLLDYFDRIGVTRAVGHTRYLKPQTRGG